MAISIWKDEFVIRGYELAKDGMTEKGIANLLGIAISTFRVYESKKTIFRLAIKMGRDAYKGRGVEAANFREYVYRRLPSDLKILWKKINKLDKAKSGVEEIEAILSKQGVRVRQHLFVYAWTASNFSISQALRKVCISRSAFDLWKKDPDFALLIEEIQWHKKNFFEEHLVKLVARGDRSATIFANETLNKDRGYNKKIDIGMEVSGQLNVNTVLISDLDLPLKTRKEILKAIRNKKKENEAVTNK